MEVVKKYSTPGWAPIKKEFINFNYVPELDEKHVKPDVLHKLAEEKDAQIEDSQPPIKKAKLKGRNKRSRDSHYAVPHKRLCPALLHGRQCADQKCCSYEHDVQLVLANKPPNLDGKCPSFRAHGHCDYGILCRFSHDHPQTKEASEVEVTNNSAVHETFENRNSLRNLLSRDLQQSLRKRLYDFSETETVLKTIFNKNSAKDKIPPREKKQIDFSGKLYLAPLTTVGNLPFRRLCKILGADITCAEMAMAGNLLQGQQSEWALLKRHESEDLFGIQICGSHPDMMTRCGQLLTENCHFDFVDINCGCPIDCVYNKGAGAALMRNGRRLESIVAGLTQILDVPLTVKIRTGIEGGKNTAHNLIPQLRDQGVSMITLHGRSREQRYTRTADWDYIKQCSEVAKPMPLFGNGDVLSYEDYYEHIENGGVAGCVIARGALIKPWIFTEIKERRHWDISSGERFDLMRDFANYGLEHWGSDTRGVETTRKFLLEWLSFTHRYIPVGILEQVPQRINDRPPYYIGRNDMETLLGSSHCRDWIKISEMLLGKVPEEFTFFPKHKCNAYK